MGGYQYLSCCIKGIELHICYQLEWVLVLQNNTYSSNICSEICFAAGEKKGASLQTSLWFLGKTWLSSFSVSCWLALVSVMLSVRFWVPGHHWGYAPGVLHMPFSFHSGTKASTPCCFSPTPSVFAREKIKCFLILHMVYKVTFSFLVLTGKIDVVT